MSHKRQVKRIGTSVIHGSKSHLETRRYRIWNLGIVGCTKVKIAMVPFSIDVGNVIEARLVRWWLDMLRLQNRLDQRIGFRCDFRFYSVRHLAFGQLRARCACARRHPPFLSFCHALSLLEHMVYPTFSVGYPLLTLVSLSHMIRISLVALAFSVVQDYSSDSGIP